jgi:hypothetical protein
MSATTAQLLQTASEIVGGINALADRLGIRERLLARFIADEVDLPDPLLLRAVDIILAHRQSQPALASQPAAQSPQKGIHDR